MPKKYAVHELLLLDSQRQMQRLQKGDLMYGGEGECQQIEDILKRNNVAYELSEANALGIYTITIR